MGERRGRRAGGGRVEAKAVGRQARSGGSSVSATGGGMNMVSWAGKGFFKSATGVRMSSVLGRQMDRDKLWLKGNSHAIRY